MKKWILLSLLLFSGALRAESLTSRPLGSQVRCPGITAGYSLTCSEGGTGAWAAGGGGGGGGSWGSITGTITSQLDLVSALAGKLDRSPIASEDGNTGSAYTLDFSSKLIHTATLNANTTITVSGIPQWQAGLLELYENAGGNHTVTWADPVTWENNQSPPPMAANKAMLVNLWNNGTYIRASASSNHPNGTGGVGLLAIQNTVLYLESSDSTTFNDGDTVTNNSEIATWNDKSPLLNNATQNTSAVRPLYKTNSLNNLPTLLFTGRHMSLGTYKFTPKNSAWTLFTIIKQDTTTAYGNTFFASVADSTHALTFNIAGDGTYFSINGDPSNWINQKWTPSGGFGTAGYHKILVIYNGSGATTASNFTVKIDGTTLTPASIATGYGGSNSVVGTYDLVYDNFGLRGNIAVLAVFQRAVNGTEEAVINSYASTTWGL